MKVSQYPLEAKARALSIFFCATVLHRFFEEFNLHGVLPQQGLKLFNLLHGRSEFRGRYNFFTGVDCDKTAVLVLTSSCKNLISIDAMEAGNMRYRHTLFDRLLNNGNFLLRRASTTTLRSGQNFDHFIVLTSAKHSSQPTSSFKGVYLSGDSGGQSNNEASGEIETAHPGYIGSQDTFYVGNLKGVGRIYQQTFVDTYSKVAHCKLYTSKTPTTAANLLNDRLLPFY